MDRLHPVAVFVTGESEKFRDDGSTMRRRSDMDTDNATLAASCIQKGDGSSMRRLSDADTDNATLAASSILKWDESSIRRPSTSSEMVFAVPESP